MTTGEKIAALRREHKLSQEALGEKLGLSRQAVSKWEADQAVPTMDNLMELSRLFGVPVDTLLRPDAPFPAPPAEENSTDAPAAPETPHKGVSPSHGKILAIGGAALLCVSLALNAVCLYQIAQLKGEVQALRVQAGNVNTVYYPGTDADTGDFAESSEHMTLDPENTEQLIVTFSAVPRVASDGETAKFLLRGGEQSWECEAEDDAGGGYRGSLTIPMVDEYSVYLVLTRTAARAICSSQANPTSKTASRLTFRLTGRAAARCSALAGTRSRGRFPPMCTSTTRWRTIRSLGASFSIRMAKKSQSSRSNTASPTANIAPTFTIPKYALARSRDA